MSSNLLHICKRIFTLIIVVFLSVWFLGLADVSISDVQSVSIKWEDKEQAPSSQENQPSPSSPKEMDEGEESKDKFDDSSFSQQLDSADLGVDPRSRVKSDLLLPRPDKQLTEISSEQKIEGELFEDAESDVDQAGNTTEFLETDSKGDFGVHSAVIEDEYDFPPGEEEHHPMPTRQPAAIEIEPDDPKKPTDSEAHGGKNRHVDSEKIVPPITNNERAGSSNKQKLGGAKTGIAIDTSLQKEVLYEKANMKIANLSRSETKIQQPPKVAQRKPTPTRKPHRSPDSSILSDGDNNMLVQDLLPREGQSYKEDLQASKDGFAASFEQEKLKEGQKKKTSSRMTIDQWIQKVKKAKRKPNVLFLIADDMRPEIKAYLNMKSPWLEPGMVTPNLDALAAEGLLFRRAYCQISWCNPSRSSFLTSRRPDTTMVHNNSVYFRQNIPQVITLPQHFKRNGYTAAGLGKVFHLAGIWGDHDSKYSWSFPFEYPDPAAMYPEGDKPWEAVKRKRDDKLLVDEFTAKRAKYYIRKFAGKSQAKPWFLAVGLKKPHMNWYFPERFLRHYTDHNISMPGVPVATNQLPLIAWFSSFEIKHNHYYKNFTKAWTHRNKLPAWMIREIRRAYYSSVSYIDDLIGQVILELKETGQMDNTIIVFLGDHGYHLGEHNIIGKNTAFEVANNSPLIIKIPGVTNGAVTDKLVEFVDLFPTMAELTDLPDVPLCPVEAPDSKKIRLCTEGSSLVPLFRKHDERRWKDSVFYQYPHYRGYGAAFCMGYSIRTERYRYTEWIHYDYNALDKANWNRICAKELYDHETDTLESTNLAYESEQEPTMDILSAKLRAGWYKALPVFDK